MSCIDRFFGEFRFLSNFWPVVVTLDGVEYPSVEHAYQAAKTLDPSERERVRSMPTAKDAKRVSYSLSGKRSDWHEVNVGIMRCLLEQKFSVPELRAALDATKGFELIEGNTWNDIHWGVCNGVGENMLGRLLMDIRDRTI